DVVRDQYRRVAGTAISPEAVDDEVRDGGNADRDGLRRERREREDLHERRNADDHDATERRDAVEAEQRMHQTRLTACRFPKVKRSLRRKLQRMEISCASTTYA